MTPRNDWRAHRIDLLEQARSLAAACDYDAALALIDKILLEFQGDTEGLRLKGNVLEQKALELFDQRKTRLVTSPEYLRARECYEQVLRLDPNNTVALIDLGDHFKNLDAYDQAFDFYERAIALIRAGESRLGRASELSEILDTCNDLARLEETAERAHGLKVICQELLDSS